jgi:hypothetical protein
LKSASKEIIIIPIFFETGLPVWFQGRLLSLKRRPFPIKKAPEKEAHLF